MGDKDYSSRRVRRDARQHGIRIIIPRKQHAYHKGLFNRAFYRLRQMTVGQLREDWLAPEMITRLAACDPGKECRVLCGQPPGLITPCLMRHRRLPPHSQSDLAG